MAQIIVQTDDGAPVVHQLGDGVATIGRDTDNTIVIPHASVSRHHAELFVSDGATTLRDLRSANGSMVNYDLVTQAPLRAGDILHFGLVQSTFTAEPPAPAKSTGKLAAALRWPFKKRRLLIGGGVMVLASAAAVVALLWPPPAVPPAPPPSQKPVVQPDVEPGATNAFWDRCQQIEQAADQEIRLLQLRQYPTLANGMYDFHQIDNAGLESLFDALTNRAHYLDRVSQEFAALNPRHVDAALAAFGQELCAQWASAARLDLDAVNLVWAVHERRLRFPATGGAIPANDDDSGDSESPTDQEKQDNQAEISRMANTWLTQRDQFVIICANIAAREKEINSRLLARYQAGSK